MTRSSGKRILTHNARGRIGIRTATLLAVDAVLFTGLAVLLLIDYQWGLAERMRDKQVAMSEEAVIILTAVREFQKDGVDEVQNYIDRACAQMQETISPGHHIAVRLDEMMLQAQTHHRASPAFAHAMQLAALAPDHVEEVDGQVILVGAQQAGNVHVFVSEFTSNIRAAAIDQLRSRAIGIALIGLVLTAIVNLVLVRLVTRPIHRLVQTVRQIGHGELGALPQHFSSAELDFLSREIGTMSRSLAQADRIRRHQMAKARQIQQHLLPVSDRLETVGVHFVHRPADEVGGDFFDVKVLDDHRLLVCVGDVTGHGVPAAMGAGMLKMLFEQCIAHLSDPDVVLKEINRRFHAITLDGDFATMLMAVIDRHAGTLAYASAGHERGYLIRQNGRVEELQSTGMLLGIDPASNCDLDHRIINSGDTVILMTDGLVESVSPDGRILGRREIERVLCEAHSLAPHQISDRLLKVVDEHRQNQPQSDDISLTILRV